MSKKILVIIPAKGKSTRIPGKNLKDLAGKPMSSYIIETALRVKESRKEIDRVIVSTDSEDVKSMAEQYGAEVPFIRPKELTLDDVPTRDVLQHTLDVLKETEDYKPDYVLLLYPTSPLLSVDRIVEAVDLAIKKDSDSVFSATLDKGHYWVEVEGGWNRLYPIKQVNSQYQIPLARENGAIYLTKSEFIKKQYVADKADVVFMEKGENIDVDYPEDFERVEKILSEKNKAS
ncbi:acylneuraminate cytidylyltransferase family protein [Candidatus Kaiserbacteria bacterium]|nr:acylneuraminate cytidylyltransferase family protein [Candidatus Kaiserbacteria bacterium]